MRRAPSIARRLTVAILGTVLVVMGIGFGVLGTTSLRHIRQALIDETTRSAALLAAYSATDLAFDARAESSERLGHLADMPEIEAAALYDGSGELFASYARADLDEQDWIQRTVSPSAPLETGIVGAHVDVLHPVVHDGRRYGTLRLLASTASVDAHFRAVATTVVMTTVGLFALAALLGALLQRVITRPLLGLADVARSISKDQDFSVRAVGTRGEIGILADGFNAMLDALEERRRAQAAAEAGQLRYAERLRLVHDSERAILDGEPLEGLVGIALAAMLELTGATTGMLVAFDADQRGARIFFAGEHPPPVLRLSLEAWADILNATGEPLTFGPDDARVPAALTALHVPPPAQLIAIPLRTQGPALGCLTIGVQEHMGLEHESFDVVLDVAEVLTLALRQQRLSEEIAAHTHALEERVAERTAALRATVGELEAFGYTVAHDLRAPLRAMQGFATALDEDYSHALDAAGRGHVGRIVAASIRMDHLIRDLLDYSRLAVEAMEVGPTDLSGIVAEAQATLERQIGERRAHVVVDDPLGMVLGHAPTLLRIVVNLLDNALKFVAGGVAPDVRIRSQVRGGVVRLWVEDKGIGIASQHHERIFRVFERLDNTHGGGTGIGLAIVKKGIERMHGSCGVESAPGEGSRFWLELPRSMP